MASLNRVLLIGNLTRDPELRYIPSGTAVAEFGLAINREFQDRTSGEKKDDVCFVDIVVWGKQGEICNQYLSKGRPVFVEGRLQYDQWEAKEGGKRSRLRVVAERVQFLGGRKDGEGGGEGGGGHGAGEGAREGGGRPAAARSGGRSAPKDAPAVAPGVGEGRGPDDLNLDDIPF
jgi:single-strand DNA-binding protein